MLLYKNHRFHCEGISFAIPEGYGLDTSYEEVPEDTLHLWTEDERLYVRIGRPIEQSDWPRWCKAGSKLTDQSSEDEATTGRTRPENTECV